MANILDEIVEHKKQEVLERKNAVSEAQLYDNLRIRDEIDSFYTAVTQPVQGDIAIIGEIKVKSPSAGVIADVDVVERSIAYAAAGVDAISYVTDSMYFGGDASKITAMKTEMSRPVLQKDFIVDTYQIVEACLRDVDALLLIARILEPQMLNAFVEFCYLYGIEPVVEIYDEEDLQRVMATQARIIGVNARNLTDFSVDIDRAASLMQKIPQEYIKIGFSGVESRVDVEVYQNAGAQAVLVGTSLMKSPDIPAFITELKNI